MIKFKRFSDGMLGSNTYIVWDEDSKEGAIIDAGSPPESFEDTITSIGIKIKYIIMTHVHFDHIFFVDFYRLLYPEAKVYAHSLEKEFFADPYKNASMLFGSGQKFKPCDLCVEEGDILPLGKENMEVIWTPGHTPGGICIKVIDMVFTGDTLFYDGFGRTDLGEGDSADLKRSIDKLYALDPALKIYPGHGTASTIGREREYNEYPFW